MHGTMQNKKQGIMSRGRPYFEEVQYFDPCLGDYSGVQTGKAIWN